jgi:hypothetical protein
MYAIDLLGDNAKAAVRVNHLSSCKQVLDGVDGDCGGLAKIGGPGYRPQHWRRSPCKKIRQDFFMLIIMHFSAPGAGRPVCADCSC